MRESLSCFQKVPDTVFLKMKYLWVIFVFSLSSGVSEMPCYLFLFSQPNSNSELRSHQLEGSSFSGMRGPPLFQSCADEITGGCTEQCSRASLGLLVQIRFPLDAHCLPVSLDRVY